MPYDLVYVPKSNIANINKFVNEYINGPIHQDFRNSPVSITLTHSHLVVILRALGNYSEV